MAVGSRALAVEGQEADHEDPKIDQLTPALQRIITVTITTTITKTIVSSLPGIASPAKQASS